MREVADALMRMRESRAQKLNEGSELHKIAVVGGRDKYHFVRITPVAPDTDMEDLKVFTGISRKYPDGEVLINYAYGYNEMYKGQLITHKEVFAVIRAAIAKHNAVSVKFGTQQSERSVDTWNGHAIVFSKTSKLTESVTPEKKIDEGKMLTVEAAVKTLKIGDVILIKEPGERPAEVVIEDLETDSSSSRYIAIMGTMRTYDGVHQFVGDKQSIFLSSKMAHGATVELLSEGVKDQKVNEAVDKLNSWNGGGYLKVGENAEVEELVAKAVGLALPVFKSHFTRYGIPSIGGNFVTVEGQVNGTLEVKDRAALKKIYDMAKSKGKLTESTSELNEGKTLLLRMKSDIKLGRSDKGGTSVVVKGEEVGRVFKSGKDWTYDGSDKKFASENHAIKDILDEVYPGGITKQLEISDGESAPKDWF